MPIDFTTDSLIDGVQRRGMIPLNQSTFDAARILAIAYDEMKTMVFPLLMRLQSEYFVSSEDQTMVEGTDTYSLPATAIVSKLRDVQIVDGDRKTSLPQLGPDLLYSTSISSNTGTAGFFLRGNNVVLYPGPTPGQTLRLLFFRRPNRLVETTEAGQVVSVNTTTKQVTLNSVPASWVVGDSVCALDPSPGFDLRFESRTMTEVSPPTFTLTDVTDIEVGDWVCLEGEATIPQIPVEAHPILEQATIVACLISLGDPKWKEHQLQLVGMKDDFILMAGSRVEGEPKTVNSFKRIGDYIRSDVRGRGTVR